MSFSFYQILRFEFRLTAGSHMLLLLLLALLLPKQMIETFT
jgi:hypothetical protein